MPKKSKPKSTIGMARSDTLRIQATTNSRGRKRIRKYRPKQLRRRRLEQDFIVPNPTIVDDHPSNVSSHSDTTTENEQEAEEEEEEEEEEELLEESSSFIVSSHSHSDTDDDNDLVVEEDEASYTPSEESSFHNHYLSSHSDIDDNELVLSESSYAPSESSSTHSSLLSSEDEYPYSPRLNNQHNNPKTKTRKRGGKDGGKINKNNKKKKTKKTINRKRFVTQVSPNAATANDAAHEYANNNDDDDDDDDDDGTPDNGSPDGELDGGGDVLPFQKLYETELKSIKLDIYLKDVYNTKDAGRIGIAKVIESAMARRTTAVNRFWKFIQFSCHGKVHKQH